MPCERCQQESEHITGRERQWLIDADVPERFLPDFREVGPTDPLASRTEPGRSRNYRLRMQPYLRGNHTEVKSLV